MSTELRTITIAPTWEAWRDTARDLLAREIPPDILFWQEEGEAQSQLFDGASSLLPKAPPSRPTKLHVPREFMDLSRTVAAHRDERRWSTLYRVLWRLTHGERYLLQQATDPEVRLVRSWEKTIHRDIHKMHAFVRFRKVGETEGRECFVAWFEPEHRILRLATPFFVKRFSGMNWSILTPEECAHWDGREVQFTAGVSRSTAPNGDVLEDLWRRYYCSIFNPARLKVRAMQAEMPQKYWHNLPEATEIAALIQQSTPRVQKMLSTPGRPPSLHRSTPHPSEEA